MENEPERGIRCTMCFDMRFERTALYAHEHGYDTISSSLGISRWKNMAQINDCGIRAASHYEGLQYWDYNWRKGGGASRMIEISKREQFYQQEYCGCVYCCAMPTATAARTAASASGSACCTTDRTLGRRRAIDVCAWGGHAGRPFCCTGTAMTALPADVALLVIDLQPDFMPGRPGLRPGRCAGGPIAGLLAQRRYRTVVATQDWHPADHASFASQHPGQRPFETILLHAQPQTLWPDHCVQGSAGAALHPGVDWTAADLILRKGTRQQVDSYSASARTTAPRASARPPAWPAGCTSAASAKCTCAAWPAITACCGARRTL